MVITMSTQEIYNEHLAQTVIENLKKRNMDGYYCETAMDAVEKALSFIQKGETVSYGGSMTLEECGMMTALRYDSDFTLLDRANTKTQEERDKLYHEALSCDTFFMSSNAITETGELVNIDGTGNRVAALIYGPKQVIVMAGMNKIVATVDDAFHRIHQIAVPKNCIRLGIKTPCATTCVCSNCLSPNCICNQAVITKRSCQPGRIKVILIGQDFGY